MDITTLLEQVKVALPEEDVELVVDSDMSREIYVNFGDHEALVISRDETTLPLGQFFGLTLYAWDRTGGVSAEAEVGSVQARWVPVVAKAVLADLRAEEDRLEQQINEEH